MPRHIASEVWNHLNTDDLCNGVSLPVKRSTPVKKRPVFATETSLWIGVKLAELSSPMVQLRFGTACERTNSRHFLPPKAASLVGTTIGRHSSRLELQPSLPHSMSTVSPYPAKSHRCRHCVVNMKRSVLKMLFDRSATDTSLQTY